MPEVGGNIYRKKVIIPANTYSMKGIIFADWSNEMSPFFYKTFHWFFFIFYYILIKEVLDLQVHAKHRRWSHRGGGGLPVWPRGDSRRYTWEPTAVPGSLRAVRVELLDQMPAGEREKTLWEESRGDILYSTTPVSTEIKGGQNFWMLYKYLYTQSI